MGTEVTAKILSGVLKDVIFVHKLKHNPAFSEEDFDRYEERIMQVSRSILRYTNKLNLNPKLVVDLFVKKNFPINGSHIPLSNLKYAWDRFRTDVLSQDLITLLHRIKKYSAAESALAVDYNVFLRDIRTLFTLWNSYAVKSSELFKKDPSVQSFHLAKAYELNYTDYIGAMRMYFYTRPVVLHKTEFGDILEQNNFNRFISESYNAGFLFNTRVYIYQASRRTYEDTDLAVVEMYNRYHRNFRKDGFMKRGSNVLSSGVVKRDFDAIKKLEDN